MHIIRPLVLLAEVSVANCPGKAFESGDHGCVRRRSTEGAVRLMCDDLVAARRLFPPSQAMCQIQARALA